MLGKRLIPLAFVFSVASVSAQAQDALPHSPNQPPPTMMSMCADVFRLLAFDETVREALPRISDPEKQQILRDYLRENARNTWNLQEIRDKRCLRFVA